MDKLARRQISKATMRIMRTSPFYTSIIMKHKPVEDLNTNGMSINGSLIKYNPDAIMKLSVPELAECMKHMAVHIAHKHHIRAASMKPRYKKACEEAGTTFEQVFDQAADLSINSLLRDCNEEVWTSENMKDSPLPGYGKFEKLESGHSAEQYFKDVLEIYENEPKEEQEQPAGANPPPCNGGLGGSGDDTEGDQGEGEDDGNGDSQGQENQDGGMDSRDNSGSSDQDDEKPQPMNFGMVEATEEDPREAEDHADEIIAQATMAAKGAGEATGSVKSIIAENEKPVKVNWRREVEQFIQSASRGRPNYRHINRRLFGREFIFPTTKDKSPKKVVLYVDVSGSMDNDCVGAVYNHIEELIEAKDSLEITLVPFDTSVFVDHIKDYDKNNTPIKTEARGRCGWGGTRFMSAIDHSKEYPEASGFIMLTDLQPCDASEFEAYKPSGAPWIILSVLEYQHNGPCRWGSNPKWARVLEIEP